MNEILHIHQQDNGWSYKFAWAGKRVDGKGADNYQLILILSFGYAFFFSNRQLIPGNKNKQTNMNKISKTKNPFIDAHTPSWEILNRLDNLICLDFIPQLAEKFVVLSYSFEN